MFGWSRHLLDALYPPIERALSAKERPSLVGWGDRDPFSLVDQGRCTADLVGATFSLYKGAGGHFTPEECVEEIVSDLRRLVQ